MKFKLICKKFRIFLQCYLSNQRKHLQKVSGKDTINSKILSATVYCSYDMKKIYLNRRKQLLNLTFYLAMRRSDNQPPLLLVKDKQLK